MQTHTDQDHARPKHRPGARATAAALPWLVASLVLLIPSLAMAQSVGGGASSNPLGLIVLMAALAILPFLLIMVTSFVKVAVVLSLLRTAIGAQQVPPNQIITGLAVILSVYIMAPVGMETYQIVEPVIEQVEASKQTPDYSTFAGVAKDAAKPIKGFLLKHADESERLLLYELAMQLRTPEQQQSLQADDLIVATPAFVLTELKEAFIIGFLLFVPFLIVDLVVANILLSLGMHMLSPTTVSLPFKLLLFVLVDGWYLVVKGLILGYV